MCDMSAITFFRSNMRRTDTQLSLQYIEHDGYGSVKAIAKKSFPIVDRGSQLHFIVLTE